MDPRGLWFSGSTGLPVECGREEAAGERGCLLDGPAVCHWSSLPSLGSRSAGLKGVDS